MTVFVEAVKAVDVRQYLDREAGKPAWVLASGPSLLHQPPGELQGGVVIATNQNVNSHKRLGFPRADYWIFGDLGVTRLWKAGQIDVHPETQKWSANLCTAFLLGWGKEIADPEAGETGTGDKFINWVPNQGPMIARELPNLWCGYRSTNAAISLAWVLGCNPIHIRGVDHGQDEKGRLHWWDYPGKPEHPSLQHYLQSYTRCTKSLRALLLAVRNSGVEITLERDKSVLEEDH